MLASLNWLSELAAIPEDPDRVAAALTARGLTVDAIDRETVPGDVVLDVDVPANRPDCLGHLGLAREIAAAFSHPLSPAPATPIGEGAPVGDEIEIEIDDPELCTRYVARIVRGVRVGPSPEPVRRRLEACGLRSINNVVDASNLVLLGLGQPVHFFDLERVRGRRIVVRRPRAPERVFRTLDGIDRTLEADTLLIADGEGPSALAGIMGGADSEIGDTTRDVLIEAAWFDPRSIRRTARRLGLSTDASQRFERGADPEAPPRAQDMAVRLLVELAGGTPAPGRIDVHPRPRVPATVVLRPQRARLLMGFDPGRETMVEALRAVGIECADAAGGAISATAPSWRVDLVREADLVEEVARHVGYDRVPARLPVTGAAPDEGTTRPLADRARDLLAGVGFHEAVCYSMLQAGADDGFVPRDARAPATIANPISEQLAVLRRTLAPGLLAAVDLNLRRGVRDVRLFEVGRAFLTRGSGALPDEPYRVALAWSGAGEPRHWSRPVREVDVFDLAGVVEIALRTLAPGFALQRGIPSLAALHPGRSASWETDGRLVAWCGALHPEVRARLDLPAEVLLAEIDLDALEAAAPPAPAYAAIPRVPASARDLALVLGPGTPWGALLDRLRRVDPPAPVSFEIVDRYAGPPLADGEVSLTVRVILQPLERTLTDERTEAYRRLLVDVVEASDGVRLRA